MTEEQIKHKKLKSRERYHAHPMDSSTRKESRRKLRLKQKIQLVTLLGGKCQKCGDTDIRHLVFHHRNGGGGKERKQISRPSYYKYFINNPEDRKKLLLLCANCHLELNFTCVGDKSF